MASLVAACGGIFDAVGMGDCSLKPVGEPGGGMRIGPAVAAASCMPQVEVDGRIYSVGVGRWLDEAALELREHGPITRANEPVIEPVAYALEGVDPDAFLVMRGDGVDDLGPMGPFMALWGESAPPLPESACRYADESDRQFPAECEGEGT